ncbi:MAG: tRNA (N(6)-L-threonylcarbamoyladenosine(37)-C(2))-methylthiotransferase MtaB [Defluviitaleaceae bacterium]|nr:tRNA (N(6)-L-threonylcarbamoyladenosine(37)-C(2))-methylthiotransferase MtaB [Defluviitaleaceae bacterium]
MNKTVAATTIGCKVNFYDTQGILEQFTKAGYTIVDFTEIADVYVVNTCSVTNLADKKSRQMIGRAKQRNPQAIVVSVGCSSQANPSVYKDLGVDIVMGTTERNQLVNHIESFEKQPIVHVATDIRGDETFESTTISTDSDRTRAFLKIQDGCDNFCTYCIIPHVRGKSRSRDFEDVMSQATQFAENGYKEIVVAGIHVASYGKDLQDRNLIDVLSAITRLEGIERVRLSSVEPNVITPEFCEFVAKTPKFCDHLHLSLQSGSNGILKLMNRKYTTDDYYRAVEQIRTVRPKINITTDVIAGFPTEEESDHSQTKQFLQTIRLSKIHVFPFSAKMGTGAAGMAGQIPKSVKKQRCKELLEISDRQENAYYQSFVGKVMSVLVEETTKDGFFLGKTTNYMPVAFTADKSDLANQIVAVKLNSVDKNRLVGILQ